VLRKKGSDSKAKEAREGTNRPLLEGEKRRKGRLS